MLRFDDFVVIILRENVCTGCGERVQSESDTCSSCPAVSASIGESRGPTRSGRGPKPSTRAKENRTEVQSRAEIKLQWRIYLGQVKGISVPGSGPNPIELGFAGAKDSSNLIDIIAQENGHIQVRSMVNLLQQLVL